MRNRKENWWQPQGWLSFGAIVVFVLLLVYLVFVGVHFIMPRVRSISKIYNDAGTSDGGFRAPKRGASPALPYYPKQ